MKKTAEDITSFLTFRHPLSKLSEYSYPGEIDFTDCTPHFHEMGLNEDQVMCKICGKLIGEIYDENRGIKKTN